MAQTRSILTVSQKDKQLSLMNPAGVNIQMWMLAGLSLKAPTLHSLSDEFSIPTFFISHSRLQWSSHKKNKKTALLAVCLQPAAKPDALWDIAHGWKQPVLTLWVWMMLLYSRATRLAHLRASLSKLCSSADPLSLCTCMTYTYTHTENRGDEEIPTQQRRFLKTVCKLLLLE